MNLTDLTDFMGITNDKKRTEPPLSVTPSTPDHMPEGERKVLYSWEVETRPAKKLDPKFMRTGLIILVVVSLLLVVMQEIFLVLAIISIAFISYVLTITPPEKTVHEITTHGVKYLGKFYYWNELKLYFFTAVSESTMLCVDTKDSLPGRLYMIINPGDRDKLKEIMSKYLPYLEEEPKNFVERAYDSVAGRVNVKS